MSRRVVPAHDFSSCIIINFLLPPLYCGEDRGALLDILRCQRYPFWFCTKIRVSQPVFTRLWSFPNIQNIHGSIAFYEYFVEIMSAWRNARVAKNDVWFSSARLLPWDGGSSSFEAAASTACDLKVFRISPRGTSDLYDLMWLAWLKFGGWKLRWIGRWPIQRTIR